MFRWPLRTDCQRVSGSHPEDRVRYSQHDEECQILEFFNGKKDGYFIDIGANDGVRNSNTRRLWELGWSGVLIEPLRQNFIGLCHNYADAHNVVLINAAIDSTNGIATFYECDGIDDIGSLDDRWVDTWQDRAKPHPILTIRLDALNLSPHPDLLSIDTEGNDYAILATMPDGFRPKLIVAETDKFDDGPKIGALLESRGYTKVWDSVSNGAWARK